jgi:uncharacterized phage protein (TIGR01671 family)
MIPKQTNGAFKMREIRFRGVVVNTKSFAYGSYHFSHLEETHCISFVNDLNDDDWHFVKGKTIGQFTGLRDKNGKEIYEGDIVKICNGSINGRPWMDKNKVIAYKEGFFNLPLYCIGEEEDSTHWCEVIGNIHENPELLK